MTIKIKRAAVLGAGVMGAQIAAHLAAAGVRTHLLDLASNEPPSDPKLRALVKGNPRAARAILAIQNLSQLKPSPILSEKFLKNIIPGNFEDDFSVIADCDFIIEVVIEKIDVKREIHKRIAEVVRPNVPVATNTSGIPLSEIAKELPEHYQSQFFGTHFFNPPRYMKLVEIIPHEGSDQKLIKEISCWISERLGKGIVYASDTTNFIANRIGVLAIQSVLKHMTELNLNAETVDALTGPLIGRPKSASLRTVDVVGIDTFVHVAKNVYDRCPSDPLRDYFQTSPWIADLVKAGHLGQKSGGVGIFQKDKKTKAILAYRPESKTYTATEIEPFEILKSAKGEKDLFKRLDLLLAGSDRASTFLWQIHRDVFIYAACLVGEIAEGDLSRIDDAMRWGFNWEYGPFELWQGIGLQKIRARLKEEIDPNIYPRWLDSCEAFYKPGPEDPRRALPGEKGHFNQLKGKIVHEPSPPYLFFLPKKAGVNDPRLVSQNKSSSLIDIGDDVFCLSFHSKMNTIDSEMVDGITNALKLTEEKAAGLVIANEGEHFSAGANLAAVAEAIQKNDFASIENLIARLQAAMQLLKYASFPTVSCPHGLVLGGGCEIALHTSHSLIHAETYAGLVEMGVGLLPAGGGSKELALRAYELASLGERADPLPFLQKAFLLIGMARVSTSGHEAVDMELFPRSARVTLSRDHQVLRAKNWVLNEAQMGYVPPTPITDLAVIGNSGIQSFRLMLYNMLEGGQVSEHDVKIATSVVTVLCGGPVDAGTKVNEETFLTLERQLFVELCKTPKTQERISHMLKTGKPLRN